MADGIRALLNFMKFIPTALVVFARRVYTGMNNNPAFPSPVVAMDELAAQIETVTRCIAEAADGSRKAIAARDKQVHDLRMMLRFLARYVEITCKANMVVFRSSGFDPRPEERTKTAPLSKFIRKIKHGVRSGEVQIRFVAIEGAASYELEIAIRLPDGTPSGESRIERFSKTKGYMTITGLTPGTFYLFRVRALIDKDFTDWSDWVTFICK